MKLLPDCHLDYETYSACDLRKTGLFIYAKHPTTRVWCAGYAFGDEEPEIWLPGQPCPPRLKRHIENGGIIVCHNAQFERQITIEIMGPQHGWPIPKLEQFRCTMAMSYAMSLPGSLEGAGAAVNLPIQKDMVGSKNMKKMAKPRAKFGCTTCGGYGSVVKSGAKSECPHCYGTGEIYTWWDSAENKMIQYAYCTNDVVAERGLEERVLPLTSFEQQVWFLDQRINERGVYIDKELCEKADAIVERAQKKLDTEMQFVTEGVVDSCSAASALLKWLNAQGVPAPDLRRETLDEMLGGWDLPDRCRRAIELRSDGSKTSTAKIKKMLLMRAEDGRARGNLQYHGAGPGRWAARGIQMQNLKRPKIKNVPDAIDAIMRGCSPQYLDMMFGSPLSVVGDCIRGMITAAPGAQLIAADLSNIEGRGVAWLAGEERKLDAFRRYDAGTGPDIYLVAAAGIFGYEIDEDDPLRQIGKVSELSLGYQGGPVAFSKMAGNYGLRIGDHYDVVWGNALPEHKEKAAKGYESRGTSTQMSEKGWKTAEVIKLAWRDTNPNIVTYWRDLEEAAISAVEAPGDTFYVNNIAYKVNGSFLWCRLPSGRALCYPYPRLVQMVWIVDENGDKSTVTREEARAMERAGTATIEGKARPSLFCKQMDDKGRFKLKSLYGGLLCENITQAVARDVMAEAMVRIDKAGYPIILTIHDEVIAEKKGVTQADVDHFNQLMVELPTWAKGYPISAKAWTGVRYKK